ncbi:hypothetical protein EDD86DRAFT_209447 [Gorgonomyces haynaldii]|nr:hypothetical protein EDD86DRAFT_209447 [Gorgonomyces haynaldii]
MVEIPTLQELCMRMLERYPQYITTLYGIHSSLYARLLRKCTPQQLLQYEQEFELDEETKGLWKHHYFQHWKYLTNDQPEEVIDYRAEFLKRQEEENEKQLRLKRRLAQQTKSIEREKQSRQIQVIAKSNQKRKHSSALNAIKKQCTEQRIWKRPR